MRKDLRFSPQSNPEYVQASRRHEELGDFSTSLRVLPISGLAVIIGAICCEIRAYPARNVQQLHNY